MIFQLNLLLASMKAKETTKSVKVNQTFMLVFCKCVICSNNGPSSNDKINVFPMFADQSLLEQKNEITVLVVNWLRCLVSPKNYLLCVNVSSSFCVVTSSWRQKQPQHLPCLMMRKTIKQNTFCLLDWHLQTLLNKQSIKDESSCLQS